MHSYVISIVNEEDDLPFPMHQEHYPAYDPKQNRRMVNISLLETPKETKDNKY